MSSSSQQLLRKSPDIPRVTWLCIVVKTCVLVEIEEKIPKEGRRLVEEKLAHGLKMSRNPVQIALLRLRKEKVLVWEYKKGTFVA